MSISNKQILHEVAGLIELTTKEYRASGGRGPALMVALNDLVASHRKLRLALSRTEDAESHQPGCPYIFDGPVKGRDISMCNCRVSKIRKLLDAR